MQLNDAIRFQKALFSHACASNPFEAQAAEAAARRLMANLGINPTIIPDNSLYNRVNFRDNALLRQLRAEWNAAHPPTPPVRKTEFEIESFPEIPFDIEGYRRIVNRKKKKRRKTSDKRSSRDEARVERLRHLLNKGKRRPSIVKEDGFTRSEISAIIRDYVGTKSAAQRYQDKPRWRIELREGLPHYALNE